jgi:hypothetical protein
MTIWLTLLLVWTTGIPIALFVAASLTARLYERRLARRAAIADSWKAAPPHRCEQRRRIVRPSAAARRPA